MWPGVFVFVFFEEKETVKYIIFRSKRYEAGTICRKRLFNLKNKKRRNMGPYVQKSQSYVQIVDIHKNLQIKYINSFVKTCFKKNNNVG